MVGKVHTEGRLGENVKSITLETSDPVAPQMVLQFKFTVTAPISIWPAMQINLQGVQGDSVMQEFIFKRPDGKPLELSNAQVGNAKGVSVELEKVTDKTTDPVDNPSGAHNGDWRVRVMLDDASQPRREAGALTLVTNHPDRPSVTMPLQIQIQPVLQITPPRVDLQVGPQTPLATITIDMRNNGYRVFLVTALTVEGDLNGVDAQLVTDQKMMVQRVRLTVPETAQLKPGVHQGKLVAKTDLKIAPTVEIPVTITVTPPAPATH
ncbi:MAG: hypothetical protein U0V87_12920 [Acidobacteriota bacterium]